MAFLLVLNILQTLALERRIIFVLIVCFFYSYSLCSKILFSGDQFSSLFFLRRYEKGFKFELLRFSIIITNILLFKGQVKCWVLPKDAYCSVKVERTLPNCQHTAFFDCSESTAGFRCTLPCKKLLCVDGHGCKKRCYEPCGPCNVQVERKLNCNHSIKIQCHVNPAKIKCKFPKSVVLPICLHKVEIPCWEPPEDSPCPLACDIRLECGHQCVERCHVKSDPHHEKYVCTKICSRKRLGCQENHKCNKKCFESCEPCRFIVRRELDCGHTQMMECCNRKENIFCQ